jgi:hypothetical protein
VPTLALALVACGGGGSDDAGSAADVASGVATVTKMSRKQWDAVPLGTSEDEVIAQFGKPGVATEPGDQQTIHYNRSPGGDAYVTFTFDADSGQLVTKVWDELTRKDVEISGAKWRQVKRGMTAEQVEALLGPPFLRRDQASSFEGAERSVVAAGALQTCLDYRGVTGTVCFDKAGKANYVHPPD